MLARSFFAVALAILYIHVYTDRKNTFNGPAKVGVSQEIGLALIEALGFFELIYRQKKVKARWRNHD